MQGIKQNTVHSTDIFAISSRTEQNTNITATCCWLPSFISNCCLLLPTKLVGDAGVTPALRRRRERAERQRSFIREQQETAATLKATLGSPDEGVADGVYNASQNSFRLIMGRPHTT
jgi:hypothetical protein